MQNRLYWISSGVLFVVALIFAVLDTRELVEIVSDHKYIPMESSDRAAGFNIQSDVKVQRQPVPEIIGSIFATGPMHSNEILRLEGECSVDNTKVEDEPKSTFGDRLTWTIPLKEHNLGDNLKITGIAHVYRRELIKAARELMADGSVRLYMNTGYVTFRSLPTVNGNPQMEVDCFNLRAVHTHGLDLMAADNKTVSHRILLHPGKQIIDRQTMPFMGGNESGKRATLEPIMIWELVPKRQEPFNILERIPNK